MSSYLSTIAFCVSLVCLIQVTSAYLPVPELQRLCALRTGLTMRDIDRMGTRNQNCAIDCITKQGTLMTTYADDGTSCHDSDGYRCVFGQCRRNDDKFYDEVNKLDLNQVEINIRSARVADRDPYPTQGESDAFVVVEVDSDGEPSFKNGDLICNTHVVQDNSRPRWDFTCKPLPMKSSAMLRFVVYDSDKPDTSPQLLGIATQSLETLMNGGLQSLTLEQPNLSGGPYNLEVEVRGKRYAPSQE